MIQEIIKGRVNVKGQSSVLVKSVATVDLIFIWHKVTQSNSPSIYEVGSLTPDPSVGKIVVSYRRLAA